MRDVSGDVSVVVADENIERMPHDALCSMEVCIVVIGKR